MLLIAAGANRRGDPEIGMVGMLSSLPHSNLITTFAAVCVSPRLLGKNKSYKRIVREPASESDVVG